MNIQVDLTHAGISDASIQQERSTAQEELEQLWSGTLDFTGWVRQPMDFGETKVKEIQTMAEEIRQCSDFFLVLGVGGSFMGAKAVIDMLERSGQSEKGQHTKVLFAGYNFSGRYLREMMDEIRDGEVRLCVISKSGTTTETLSAYGIFKEMMLERYGREETAARTWVITEHRSNYFFDEATREGCHILELPEDIGGRYSVLTPVGLLPVAVAGIDIDAMMQGAHSITSKSAFAGHGLDYAIMRQMQYRAGKQIEIFEFFDPYFEFFGEWLKQLFGESEGKEGKGLFPASLMFSRDLHSMGQFLQQGTPCFFETFLTVDVPETDVTIPGCAMPPFAGKTIQQINHCAEQGVRDAHIKAGIPVLSLSVPRLDAAIVGELLYYFETQCAVSAMLSGVNPFDQPGVEAYKREMRTYIGELS